MNKNKYTHTFLMFSLILFLGTRCNPGGGGSGSSSNNSSAGTVESGTHSIELSWTPPASRVNGDRLYAYEIGGYEVLYRQVDEQAWNSITIHDEAKNLLDTYTIEGVPPGRYEVKIATFDIDGRYSVYSDPAFVDKF